MSTNKTKRRFPMEDNFMKGNKHINTSKPNDILYGYLQMISNYREEDNVRFVYKTDYSHTDVQNHFGVDENGKYVFPRKNVERAMRVLIQYGYVRETKVQGLQGNLVSVYELPYNVEKPFQYIELHTLRFLLNTCNPNVIKLYIFFKYKYFCFGTNFTFTQKMLIEECFGLSANTRNKKVIQALNDRLEILKALKLIDWCEFVTVTDSGKPVPRKRLTYFSDIVECNNNTL